MICLSVSSLTFFKLTQATGTLGWVSLVLSLFSAKKPKIIFKSNSIISITICVGSLCEEFDIVTFFQWYLIPKTISLVESI